MHQRQEKKQERKIKRGKRAKKKKNGSGQWVKPSTPTLAIDALRGEEEEKNGKQREQKKETRNRAST